PVTSATLPASSDIVFAPVVRCKARQSLPRLQGRCPQRRDQSSDLGSRRGASHDGPHDRDSRGSGPHELRRLLCLDAADGEDWNGRGGHDRRKALRAEGRAIASLALGFICGSGDRIVDDRRIELCRFPRPVDRNADEALAAEQGACARYVTPGRKVCAVETCHLGKLDIAVQRQSRVEAPHNRQQTFCQRNLLLGREILLPHTDPAATRCAGSRDDVQGGKVPLPAIRDQQRGGLRQPHAPTRPNCGLDGSALFVFGMRPASRAKRPASTAARIAAAMPTGSRALDTAVLSRTAAQPSSMAKAASDAVPMPASSTTGTGERAHTRSIRSGLEMPRPEPIGEPSGMTAAAPTSASLRQVTGSSLQYGSTTKSLPTSVSVACTTSSTSG